MRRVYGLLSLALAAVEMLRGERILTPPIDQFQKQTFTAECMGVDCAKLTLFYYGQRVTNEDPLVQQVIGGAVMAMQMQPILDAEYHWIQAVVLDSKAPAWRLDSEFIIPTPFLDPPPAGYTGPGQLFDFLPWYDQSTREVTRFFDAPGFARGALDPLPGKSAAVSFETWLVCVISTDLKGFPDLGPAKDNKVTVAPLFGFTWGFETIYDPAKDPQNADSTKNMSVTLQALNTSLKNPTSSWLQALDRVYGPVKAGTLKGHTEQFSVTLGSCVDCGDIAQAIPEPATAWLTVLAILLLGCRRLARTGTRPA